MVASETTTPTTPTTTTTTTTTTSCLTHACPFLCGVLSVMMASEQPGSGAARRRRQRRLRSWLRHERMTVAMALAESTHHSSRGQTIARAGVWGREMNYTATIRDPLSPPPLSPPPPLTPTHTHPSRSSAASTRKSPAGRGLTGSSRSGRRRRFSGTPWSSLPTTLLGCRRLTFLCR